LLGHTHSHTHCFDLPLSRDRVSGFYFLGNYESWITRNRQYWDNIQELLRTSKCAPGKTGELAVSEILRRMETESGEIQRAIEKKRERKMDK
jgi:hypothetical protein